MRKYIYIFIMALCLAGCGQKEASEESTEIFSENLPTEGEKEQDRLRESQSQKSEFQESESQESQSQQTPGTTESEEQQGGQTEEQNSSKSQAGFGEGPAGALSVKGTKLVDSEDNPVQLRGISTHGLAWFPDYINADCIRQLKEEWGMNVIRLAMYTAESGGYCTGGNRDDLKALVKNGVEYATDCGMYVIIDWHILSDGNPNTYIDEAKAFFEEMSTEYADYTNVLYEICNEPNGGTSWSDVKAYAEQVIAVIRENDEEGIILVGTPNWSQYVEQAAADPITDYSNIMYTLHFYAATHTDSLRASMINAIGAGLPVFVSEYGICDASGNGAIDENQAGQWVQLMDENQISYVAWNLSNKSETSAVIKSGCSKTSGFTEEDLSESGKWLYKMLQSAGSAGELTGSGQGQSTDGTEPANGDGPANRGTSGTEGAENNHSETEGSQEEGLSGELEEDGLGITAERVNSWKQGEECYYQYRLTITNSSDGDREGWTIRLAFNGGIALSDGWNGEYRAEGNVLTISSKDYNAFIGKGGSVSDIGFIVKGGEGLAIEGL